VPLLVGTSLFSWALAARLQVASERLRKPLLAVGVTGLLATLVCFKYLTFALAGLGELLEHLGLHVELKGPELALPVGLSFFTFHGISLLVDAYRKEIPLRVRLLDALLYMAFFPQLVAGPIIRAKSFLPQLDRGPSPRVDASAAFVLFLGGLAKKVLFANFLATHVVDPVYAAPEAATTVDALLAFYGYAAQIYCDFSGYTDMAIAAAMLLGYEFPQNFDSPYLAKSPQEFWRRWHISLSSWLRDYLYIPLGGSKKGPGRTALSLTVTMLLGGLWHGAGLTFVLWGAVHGVALALQRLVGRAPGRLLTFHFVCAAWVLFRAPSLDVARSVVRALWHPTGEVTRGGFATAAIVVLALATQAVPAKWTAAVAVRLGRLPLAAQALALSFFVVLIDALGPDGVLPFIYFQF
jgi:D-alanyl-lipoteichoic acid acyltransferase DltB (MBOAT superfamily)